MIKWLTQNAPRGACLLLLWCILSCTEAHKTETARNVTANAKKESSVPPAPASYSRIAGAYSGDFDGSDIRVVLRHLTGRNAVGYNLHRGLRRNISGSMSEDGSGYAFELSEPGDHPYDGIFRFTIDTTTRELKGVWTPQRKSSGLAEKVLTLHYVKGDTLQRDNNAAMFMDTLGNFSFFRDGLVRYSFYPKNKGSIKQLQTITGNWTQAARTIRIDWAPNDVFPSRKTMFAIKGDGDFLTESYELTLEGAGRSLYTGEF